MGRVIMNGPLPNRDWCVACLMDAKQKQWEQYQDEIQAGWAAPGDKVTVIPWPEGLTNELAEGPYRAVCGDLSMLGIVDGICWRHVAGTNPSETPGSLLEARGQIPPGLLKGGR